MSRYCGKIGFEIGQRETEPGIFEPCGIEERAYTGNLPKHFRKWETTQNGTNDNFTLANQISIVCDSYMTDHWPAIKYAEFGGVKWKVESAEIKRPRILLTLGGMWNGNAD